MDKHWWGRGPGTVERDNWMRLIFSGSRRDESDEVLLLHRKLVARFPIPIPIPKKRRYVIVTCHWLCSDCVAVLTQIF
jgi:hypothetical protein